MHVVPNHTRGGSLVITGSRDSKVKVWQQKSQLNKISYMRNIGSHTKTVSSLRLHKSSNAVISVRPRVSSCAPFARASGGDQGDSAVSTDSFSQTPIECAHAR